MLIQKHPKKASLKNTAMFAGLVFYLWVFGFFIHTINASNREIENLDYMLSAASGILFRIVSGSALSPDPAGLDTVLERIRTNRALQNLVDTLPDGELTEAMRVLANYSSPNELNDSLTHIGARIRLYKSVQYEAMSELFFLFTLLVVMSIIISVMAYRENRKKLAAQDIQTELNRKLSAMLEAERNIISLELHDDLAQKLSVIKHHFMEPEADAPHSEILRRYIADSIGTVRRIANRLRSPLFDRFSLQEQLLVLFSDFSGSCDIKLTHQAVGLTSLDLDDTAKLHLYRIVQELLSNCRKHSGASKAAVKILYSHPLLSLQYSDDGVGYDPATVARGLGLNGIDFRLALLGGVVRDESALRQGSRVKIEVRV